MQPLTAAEIRERFLRFFEARGHKRLPSDSLVPRNDPTLLFTGAGMNQFKDMFLGRGTLPWKRVATAQKCLRVPDLDNVGLTPRHHTFFEMLGNFSFGDYFKRECITWEWEFFRQELGIPERQMVVTIYQDDDEAHEIWRQDVGLPADKVFRFGEKENFWPAEAPSKGPNGPCGPCSEIYFDARPELPLPGQDGLASLPEDRFLEIGNCVFTQFDRQEGGRLQPLPQKNIDVGLGLERITAVLAGAKNNFETELFRPYLEHLERTSGVRYGQDDGHDVRMRRIADHVRAVTFCIADGARPSNEGRGYVVRKILRRAIRDGYELGIEQPFLHAMSGLVADAMGDVYAELREHRGQCRALIQSEEETFAAVYRSGMDRLQEYLHRVRASGSRGGQQLVAGSGEFAFQLHDTYGFPVDITRQVMAERGLLLDEAGFERAMEQQRERARAASATEATVFAKTAATVLRERGVPPTRFVGYDTLHATGQIAALLDQERRWLERAGRGERVQLVCETTPFYAQGGGQVGDRGSVLAAGGRALVQGTTNLEGYWLHQVEVSDGELRRGQAIELVVDEATRRATERNHTATHLLHAALKQVLGQHVSQAGSEVAPERLRFDYTHGNKPTDEQLAAIEDFVNRVVMTATPVTAQIRPLEEARRDGFVAMFGEKYGDLVRTLAVGEHSKELCGGTHVANSGNIGLFRIVGESAISAGTRRIEAVTGTAAQEQARSERNLLADVARALKSPPGEVAARVAALLEDDKRLRKELEKATAADLGKVFEELRAACRTLGGVQRAVLEFPRLQMKEVQEVLARARKDLAPFVGIVLAPGPEDVLVGAAVSSDQTGRWKAGQLVKELCALLGGGGGGRDDLAQGKGRDASKLPAAHARAQTLIGS
jgi:alanyl-tRNA synthetase